MTPVERWIISAIVLSAMCLLSACSVEVKSQWFGRTGIDDRTITPTLYRPTTTKARY